MTVAEVLKDRQNKASIAMVAGVSVRSLWGSTSVREPTNRGRGDAMSSRRIESHSAYVALRRDARSPCALGPVRGCERNREVGFGNWCDASPIGCSAASVGTCVPSVEKVQALCDVLQLEFYIGPPRDSLALDEERIALVAEAAERGLRD